MEYTKHSLHVVFTLLCVCSTAFSNHEYVLDISAGLGRQFDGIGGLSGGGATSKLLVNYPEPEKTRILDFLFKPNFGASLDILKVEIGGDSQSTDGTESSHMHTEHDERYDRGYEWWLMVEAKRRNPDIKLYALPWAFPGWIGEGTQNPYINPSKTASYIIKWVQGAKTHYNLTIDYVGIWNERAYSLDYILTLRSALDASGLSHVRIVGTDSSWGIADTILKNATVANAVDIIGVHYPNTNSKSSALTTKKALWSSEDYSTYNDNKGAGCWAYTLNQNYVNGHMTSTISWNLIAAYYDALPWHGAGLMTANEPWSGHYIVAPTIWISAHTTQFTEVGWHYLQHGSGVGKLKEGGSYVSLICPCHKQLTIVIESMQHQHALCGHGRPPKFTVKPQNVTFVLKPSLQNVTQLNVWSSKLTFDDSDNGTATTQLLIKRPPVKVVGGRFTIEVLPDEVHTLTTVSGGNKGQYPDPPASKAFPLPYTDDFESYPLNSEAYNFAPQIGVWEVLKPEAGHGHNQVNVQVITEHPVDWCHSLPIHNLTHSVTMNIGGDFSWTDISISVDIFLPDLASAASGAFLGVHVDLAWPESGSCRMKDNPGVYLALYPSTSSSSPGLLTLSTDMVLRNVTSKTSHNVPINQWFNLKLAVQGSSVEAYLDGELKIQSQLDSAAPTHGFTAYGTSSLGVAYFDNVIIK